MTVSRVINNRPDVSPTTRQHVQQIIEKLGYAPSEIARSLSHGRSSTLAVVSAGLEFYGPSRTLVGIEQKADELGFSLMVRLLHNPAESPGKKALKELIANQVAGIIWAVAEIGDQRDWIYQQPDKWGTPIVFLSMGRKPQTSFVSVDNHLGASMATHHLLEQGYRRIGIIAGPHEWWESQQRERGWFETLQQAGINDLAGLREEGDWTAASGYGAMMKLLRRATDLDAVFVANDSMALGALQAAAQFGLTVPQDLAVVGFDDIPESAYFSPSLTTIRQDLLELGCQAVALLNGQLLAQRNGKPADPQHIILEPHLIIRRSSVREIK